MNLHVNGWRVIETALVNRKLAQRNLAQYLEITPSAVTQAKKGGMYFSLAQLALICEFLHLREQAASELFSEVLNARLIRSLDALNCSHRPRNIACISARCRWAKIEK